MRKPLPINPADALALAQWLGEARELTANLHAAAMDATSSERVYSRKELRKRFCRLTRRLGALFDALEPSSAGAVEPAGKPKDVRSG